MMLILPTALFLNRLVAVIAIKTIRNQQPSIDIDIKDVMKLINTVKEYKRKHKDWEFINISSADGDIVWIRL